MAELPILHSQRPQYEWIEKLNKLRDAYRTVLESDPGRAERDQARLDVWLVYHSLRLKGAPVTMEAVEAVRAGIDPGEPAVAGSLAAVGRLREAARDEEELTPGLLLELNRRLDPESGGRLRTGPPMAVYQGHTAPGPEGLDALLENATDWFLAESFRTEFHPVEQASLVLIRICDLQPFPSNNELTARLAASLYPLRGGFPPIIVLEELEAEYRKAVLHAVHMDTTPMIELIARCLARTYDDLLGWNLHALVDEE